MSFRFKNTFLPSPTHFVLDHGLTENSRAPPLNPFFVLNLAVPISIWGSTQLSLLSLKQPNLSLTTSSTGLQALMASSVTMMPGFLATDPMMDEFCRQLAVNTARRVSRGSSNASQHPHPHQHHGMRISKPNSANNSPGGSMNSSLARRRTLLLNDNSLQARRRQQYAIDQATAAMANPMAGGMQQTGYMGFPDTVHYHQQRAPRPVSWHPSTNMQHNLAYFSPGLQHQQALAQQQQQQYPVAIPQYTESDLMAAMAARFPPTPMAYSGQTSPASAFSPLTLPFSTFGEAPPFLSVDTYGNVSPVEAPPLQLSSVSSASDDANMNQQQRHYADNMGNDSFGLPSSSASSEMYPSASTDVSTQLTEWAAAYMDGAFADRPTAPPTPDAPFSSLQQQEPYVAKDDEEVSDLSADPATLDDAAEGDGEILVGLGLYDPPEKVSADGGEFDAFGLMAPSAFGTFVVGSRGPRTGKGLKLEESWEPPPPEPESDEEEEDGDEDAEGEEQDDDEENGSGLSKTTTVTTMTSATTSSGSYTRDDTTRSNSATTNDKYWSYV